MLIYDVSKSCVAVSYDTATFNDLKFYLSHYHNVNLLRVEPDVFFTTVLTDQQYINLVIKDFDLRRSISEFLDNKRLDRFSFIHPTAVVDGATIEPGSFFYPLSTCYPSAKIGNDVIVHAYGVVAHCCNIGQGTILSGKVVVAGSSTIGKFCSLGVSSTIYDNVSICDCVTVSAGAIIRKAISKPGTYFTKSNVKKLRDINIR